MPRETPFDLKFTSREVTAWGGLALLKRMLDGMGFKEAVRRWDLPPPGSNRGYLPEQLIEQLMVSIWCGAARFAHTDITRLDTTLVRLFGWGKAAGHKAIIRLFQRFDQPIATRVQTSSYRWLFDTLRLNPITLDVDSTVLTRWGSQMEGAAKGYNAKNKGRASHHPLMAFVADWRLVANFWLRPGNTASSNNFESFIESTLDNLGQTRVGLLRADSGFYDKTIVARLQSQENQPHHQCALDARSAAGHRGWVQMAASRGGAGGLGAELPTPWLGCTAAPGGGAPAHPTQKRCSSGQDAVAVCR
jgi:hypothetical protein